MVYVPPMKMPTKPWIGVGAAPLLLTAEAQPGFAAKKEDTEL
jgi:hypothetical protein